MKILTLSGWGQPHDALSGILPDAVHFDYTGYPTIDDALKEIAGKAQGYDAIAGWSLGGQLAARAIANGLMKTAKLVLIAVPFQFVQTSNSKTGMPRDKFDKFRDNYKHNPARTLAKAWELIAINDTNADIVRICMAKNSQQDMLAKDWLRWLDMLDGFSFENIDMGLMPPTLLIHGTQDAVVDFEQSHEFTKAIPQARHIAIQGAGHAPHFHDEKSVQNYIRKFLNV